MKFFIKIILPIFISIILYYLSRQISPDEQKYVYWAILFLTGGLFIFGVVQGSFFLNRCSKCGEWNAMEFVSKELVGSIRTNKVKELKKEIKNAQGEIVRTTTKQIMVPALKNTYKVYEKCKKCANIKVKTETEIVEI